MYNIQNIVLHIIKSPIIEAVKNETFIRSKVEKTSDESATALAYNVAAGDDEHHERKLERSLAMALEEEKTFLSDYLSSVGWTSADNAVIMSESDTDSIDITLRVSRRFNNSYVESLAKLISKYVEDRMVYEWFLTYNPQLAANYQTLIVNDQSAIRRCFNKTAPRVPKVPYTRNIIVEGTTIEIAPREKHTVTYTIDDDVIDDVEAASSDERVFEVFRHRDGEIYIHANNRGVAKLWLYSRHNDMVKAELRVKVAEEYRL